MGLASRCSMCISVRKFVWRSSISSRGNSSVPGRTSLFPNSEAIVASRLVPAAAAKLFRVIPGALYFNLCIDAFGNGDEDVGQPHESVPCVTAPIDDSLIVLINNVAELITSEVLPEIL